MLILDLSNNNAEPDWPRLKTQNIDAVYLKASEGTTFVDKTFASRRAIANKHGLKVGAYHFARPDASSPEDQARAFVRVIGKVGLHDLRPALDFEAPSRLHGSAQLVLWARRFNREVKRLTGVLPIFYTYSAYANQLNADKPIGAGLWLASYSRNDGREHAFSIPAPWKGAVAHQFSSRCYVGGCSGPVDLSSAKSLNPILAHPVWHRVSRVLPYLGRH